MIYKESILDAPSKSLDPSVWSSDSEGNLVLTDEAQDKILKLVDWIQERYDFPDLSVMVVGSIASNSYSSESDIDIDFCSPWDGTEQEAREIGWKMKEDFLENYMKADPSSCTLGSHPFEVYFLPNQFQCMMSAGCYNFTASRWEVGPDMKELDFDPSSEYFKKSMKIFGKSLDDIRNVVLRVYELAKVATMTHDEDFEESIKQLLVDALHEAGLTLRDLKVLRSGYGADPSSKAEAMKLRLSKEWHQADAAFKFLDKFGYVSILKKYAELDDKLSENADSLPLNEIASSIIQINSEKISEEDDLTNLLNEQLMEIDEDAGRLAKILLVAAAIAINGLVPQEALAKEMKSIPKSEFRFNSKSVNKAILKVALEKLKFGKLSFVNMTNLLATITYNEAALDYVKYNDKNCLIAILNTIDNRAGGDPVKYASIINAPSLFFSKSHVKGGYEDATYKMYDPRTEGVLTKKTKEAWDLANQYAILLLKKQLPLAVGYVDGKLTKFGNRNMIANASKDNAGAWNSWGKQADLVIGRHTFGYRPEHDGYRKNSKKSAKPANTAKAKKAIVHVVRSGESLYKIAKLYKKDIKTILKKNNIKNPNLLKIGLKLVI